MEEKWGIKNIILREHFGLELCFSMCMCWLTEMYRYFEITRCTKSCLLWNIAYMCVCMHELWSCCYSYIAIWLHGSNSPPVMRPWSSLPCSHEPATGPCLCLVFQIIRPSPRPCVTFRNMLISYVEKLLASHSTPPPPQDGDPPLIGCLRLLIKYISSYPPYLEAVAMPWGQRRTVYRIFVLQTDCFLDIFY